MIRIEEINQVSPELREAVQMHLRAFNRAANPDWYAARAENEPQPLQLFTFDDNRQPRGGLFGETFLQWLKISTLAVHEEWRGRGTGKQLMRVAEMLAVQRGCQHAYVDTMDYQAPGFYEKLGYEIVGRLDNWDSHGHAKLFLTKALL